MMYALDGIVKTTAILAVCLLLVSACKTKEKKAAKPKFQYEFFKDSIIKDKTDDKADAINLFDAPAYTPDSGSIEPLLIKIDTLLRR